MRLLPLLVLLCILPFAHTVALRVACLVLGCLVAAPTLKREWRTLPCAWQAALWASIGLASIAWSVRPWYSLGEYRNEVIQPLLAFYVFYAMVRGEEEWRRSALALAAGFVVVTALAASYWWSSKFWFEPGAVLGHVNQVSTYLVLVAPALAAFALLSGIAPKRLLVPVFVGATLLVLAGLLTQNRTMWLALVAQTVLFAALFIRSEVPRRNGTALGIAAVGAVCVPMVALFALASFYKTGTMPLSADGLTANVDQSVRLQIWRGGLDLWAERPLLGYGFGKQIVDEQLVRSFGWVATHAHNMFLNHALATGAIGVASLGVLFYGLAARFWGFLRATDRDTRIIAICGLCLIAGALVRSTTDDPLVRDNSMLFWALLGLFFGRLRGLEERRAASLEAR